MNAIYIDLVENPDTPVTLLNSVLVNEFGSAFYNWELESIWRELLQATRLKSLNDVTKDKIGALIALTTAEGFYNAWECFEKIGKAFNDQDVHFEDLTPLEPEELVWTIVESKLNDDSQSTFSLDVESYFSTVFKKHGIATCPSVIKPYFNYKQYNSFDKDIEEVKQQRISAYVLLRANNIIRLARRYFGQDVRVDLVREHPWFREYLLK